jgi:hypothetical protein
MERLFLQCARYVRAAVPGLMAREATELPARNRIGTSAWSPARLRSRYRRPLLQILLRRRISPEAAEKLIVRAVSRVSHVVRGNHDVEYRTLEELLYRTTCDLAAEYHRGDLLDDDDMLPAAERLIP